MEGATQQGADPARPSGFRDQHPHHPLAWNWL